jgi:hypothetical protein
VVDDPAREAMKLRRAEEEACTTFAVTGKR